jgi:hypothetical protein
MATPKGSACSSSSPLTEFEQEVKIKDIESTIPISSMCVYFIIVQRRFFVDTGKILQAGSHSLLLRKKDGLRLNRRSSLVFMPENRLLKNRFRVRRD